MKHHILRDFSISTPLKEKFSHDFKDLHKLHKLHKLQLLINCDAHLTSSQEEVRNNVFNV